jgi:hypothetical protein
MLHSEFKASDDQRGLGTVARQTFLAQCYANRSWAACKLLRPPSHFLNDILSTGVPSGEMLLVLESDDYELTRRIALDNERADCA